MTIRKPWLAVVLAGLVAPAPDAVAAIRGQLDVVGDGSTSVISLSHPFLDGNPDALLLAISRDFNAATGIGVRYSGGWGLSSNGPAIPSNAHYQVLAFDEGSGFRHVNSAGNTTDHYTVLDDARLNGHPEAFPIVQREIPSEVPTIAFPYGVHYDVGSGRWRVAFEDTTRDMPVGPSFSVFIPEAHQTAFLHVADAGTVSNNFTVVDDPEIEDQTAPHRLYVTPRDTVVANDRWIAVSWLFSHLIGNIDDSAVPVGASFHVFIAPIFANGFEDDGTGLWSDSFP